MNEANSETNDLIVEIRRAEKAIEDFSRFYHAKEKDCPDSFKILMLMNGWNNPFIALNELLKRIDTNEMLLKRKQKETGPKTAYKSRYKEMRELIQNANNSREK